MKNLSLKISPLLWILLFYFATFSSPGYAPPPTPPLASSFSPTDNSTNVAIDTNLVITFNKTVLVDSGNIYIKLTSDDSILQTIAANSGSVTGYNSLTLTINPPTDLPNNTSIYINISSTAITGISGLPYAGIADNTTWNFTTVAGGDLIAPSISYFSPPDNSHYVQSYSGVSIVFNEAVQVGSGSIIIKKSSDDTVLDTISVNSSNITGWGTSTINIKPSINFADNISYYIQVDIGSILDLSGNSFSGVSSPSTWNFNTKSSPSSFMGSGL